MIIKFLTLFFLIFYTFNGSAQDVKLTPDMYEYSIHSITGVYVCTPTHVENGDCSDVDKEYYDNLARLTLGVYEIGLLAVNDTKTVAFKGPLSPGAADSLISILKNHPEIDTLVLSSQGGSEEEAYKIADYVKARGMKTWVPVRRMCLSACSSIFLSGKTQTLDGLLGLHTGQFNIQDPYQVRNLEAARKTIQDAMYENDQFMMKRIKLFLSNDLPLSLIETMIEARGDFLVFSSLHDLHKFDPKQNYVMSFEEMSEAAKAQPPKNFDFKGYEQLF